MDFVVSSHIEEVSEGAVAHILRAIIYLPSHSTIIWFWNGNLADVVPLLVRL
jgi:hypothetical protein